MNKNFYTSTATGEVWTRPDWKPFPKTAPKDHREIMVFGRWKGDEVKDGKIIKIEQENMTPNFKTFKESVPYASH